MSGALGAAGRAAASAGLAAAAAVACAALGAWQLDRAEQRRAVAAAFAAAGQRMPLTDVGEAAAAAAAERFRRLRVDGRYEPREQVLLDNITRGGRAGYYVLTPFAPAGTGPRVLVNRGWIAADPDRASVPGLEIGNRVDSVSGRIDRMPSAALSLEASPETPRAGLYRLSFPTLPELERVLGVELAPFQLLLDPDEPAGFSRDWSPDTRRADRNTAYAGQWFIMAVAAAGLAVWAGARAYRAGRGSAWTDEASP